MSTLKWFTDSEEEAQDVGSIGRHWTQPLPWGNSNIHIYREQLLLWENWGLNKQLLNNIQEKETKQRRLGNCKSPVWDVGTVCTWTGRASTIVYIPLHYGGAGEALFRCLAYLQDHHNAFLATLPRAFWPQARTIGHHHTDMAACPGAAAARQASVPGAVSTCPAPACFPKLPGT